MDVLASGVKDARFFGFDADDDDRYFAILTNIGGTDMMWVAEDSFVDPAGFYVD